MLIGFGPRRQAGPETGDSIVPQSDRVAFVRDGDVYAGGQLHGYLTRLYLVTCWNPFQCVLVQCSWFRQEP